MLSHGDVQIRPPREEEFALLIELRNRERRWFGDQSELKYDDAAKWLAARHDGDSLFCIVVGESIVGTVGWAKVPGTDSAYEIGRGIANYQTARQDGCDRKLLYRAIRTAGCLAIDHLFGDLQASVVYARNRPENGLVRRLISEFSPRTSPWPFSSSKREELESWHIVAADWAAIRDKVFKQIDARIGEKAAKKKDPGAT